MDGTSAPGMMSERHMPSEPVEEVAGVGGRPVAVSATLRDQDGRVLFSWHGDRLYYAASTMKLAVAMAALRQVDEGRFSLNQTTPALHEWASDGGGTITIDDPDDADPEYPADDAPITVAALITGMIERSSNECTNTLMRLVGIDAIHTMTYECGMRRLHVDRLINDVAGVRATGLRNEVTSDDLSSLMVQAARGDRLSPASTAFLRDVLRGQQYPDIARVLPTLTGGVPVDWGSKSGWVPGISHDVAFVGDPAGGHWHALAVCTSGFGEVEGAAVIRAVAAAALGPLLEQGADGAEVRDH